ncbi:MAG TPA: hypothetical protein VNV87_05340 [Acidimicrobiales bacterium]|jgi:hypothetical protein|nr:hypothetical protein [Acidimicrobiales bacterium]
MQFLVTLTLDQVTSSPAELQSAMTAFVENELEAGRFVITGGLAPQADAVRIELSPGAKLQGAARLPVHGFAVVEAPSLSQTIDAASRMLKLHQDCVPDWAGNCEVRPIVTHCLP